MNKLRAEDPVFHYPTKVVYPDGEVDILAPWLTSFPATPAYLVCAIIKVVGARPAGLYALRSGTNAYALGVTYEDYAPLAAAFYSFTVYLEAGTTSIPAGSKVFNSGVLTDVTEIPSGTSAIWVVASPQNGGGPGPGPDGGVKSVDGVLPNAAGNVNLNLATVARSGSYSDLSNKPIIPAAQVQSDWNATSGMGAILNKPAIPPALNPADFATAAQGAKADTALQPGDVPDPVDQVPADWNATTGPARILNKPTIPAAQVQPDWNATSGMGSILNKPTIPPALDPADFATAAQGAKADTALQPGDIPAPTEQVNADWNATTGKAQILNKPTIPDPYELPAATPTTRGGIRPGSGLEMVGDVLSIDATAGLGTVTSVDVDLPAAHFNVAGGPVTDAGTITATWKAQAQSTILAGPASGVDAAPEFRHLDATDIPALDASKTTTGVFPPARLGTGTPSADNFLAGDGTFKTPPAAEAQVNADWDATSGKAQILNKPVIPPALNPADFATAAQGAKADTALQPGDVPEPVEQVNSDWNAASGKAQILNKPMLGTAAASNTGDFATAAQGAKADTALQPGDVPEQVQPDWNATTGKGAILNKPTIPPALDPADFATAAQGAKADTALQPGDIPAPVEQVNSDWNAASGKAQILNKPTLGSAAASNVGDFATAAQGAKAETALQPGDVADQVNADWNATTGKAQILNKPTIPAAYTLPTASDTIKGGVRVGSGLSMTGEVLSADPAPTAIASLKVEDNFLKKQDTGSATWENVAAVEDFSPINPIESNMLSLSSDGLLVRPRFPLDGHTGDVLAFKAGSPSDYQAYQIGPSYTENPTLEGNRSYGIATNDHVFVTGGKDIFFYSYDGYNWIQAELLAPAVENDSIQSIVWAVNEFVAVTFSGRVLVSETGKSWDLRTTMPFTGQNIYNMVFANGRLVVAGSAGTWVPWTAVSLDHGATWTESRPTFPSQTSTLRGLAVGLGIFVACGYGGQVFTSPDGLNWTQSKFSASYSSWMYAITFSRGLFVAGGDSNTAFISRDAVNWTQVTMPASAAGKIIFYASFSRSYYILSYYNGSEPAYSKDGVNWRVISSSGARMYGARGTATMGGTMVMVNGGSSCYVSTDGVGTKWVNGDTGRYVTFRHWGQAVTVSSTAIKWLVSDWITFKGWLGCRMVATPAPSASTVFQLLKNGTLAGRITVGTDGVAVFTNSSSDVEVHDGDILSVSTPANLNGITEILITLRGLYTYDETAPTTPPDEPDGLLP